MRCPTCEREFEPHAEKWMPFCCERCQLIDLGRWLGEENALPHVPDPEADEVPDVPWDVPTDDVSATED